MSRVVEVAARPAPHALDLDSTAVVVVDMQNDFGAPGGMFERAGIDIRPIQSIIEPIAGVLAAARATGMPVIYLKMAFEPDLADVDPESPTWLKHLPLHAGEVTTAPDGTKSRVLVRDTWNTEIVEPLAPAPDDLVVYKNRYSGFYGTELEDVLRARGVRALIVVGATTSVCVDSTIRDAVFRDLHCLVLEDCVAEPIGNDTPRSNHEASLLTFELLFADISSSACLLDALDEPDLRAS
jgi:ureidoacrylate peracid hydrolase